MEDPKEGKIILKCVSEFSKKKKLPKKKKDLGNNIFGRKQDLPIPKSL